MPLLESAPSEMEGELRRVRFAVRQKMTEWTGTKAAAEQAEVLAREPVDRSGVPMGHMVATRLVTSVQERPTTRRQMLGRLACLQPALGEGGGDAVLASRLTTLSARFADLANNLADSHPGWRHEPPFEDISVTTDLIDSIVGDLFGWTVRRDANGLVHLGASGGDVSTVEASLDWVTDDTVSPDCRVWRLPTTPDIDAWADGDGLIAERWLGTQQLVGLTEGPRAADGWYPARLAVSVTSQRDAVLHELGHALHVAASRSRYHGSHGTRGTLDVSETVSSLAELFSAHPLLMARAGLPPASLAARAPDRLDTLVLALLEIEVARAMLDEPVAADDGVAWLPRVEEAAAAVVAAVPRLQLETDDIVDLALQVRGDVPFDGTFVGYAAGEAVAASMYHRHFLPASSLSELRAAGQQLLMLLRRGGELGINDDLSSLV